MKFAKNIGLGAATSFQDIFLDKKIRKNLKILPQISVWFADDQIREQATLEEILLMRRQQQIVLPLYYHLMLKLLLELLKVTKIIKNTYFERIC